MTAHNNPNPGDQDKTPPRRPEPGSPSPLTPKTFLDRDMLEWDSEIAEASGFNLPLARTRPPADSLPETPPAAPLPSDWAPQERLTGMLGEPEEDDAPPDDYEEGGMRAGADVDNDGFDDLTGAPLPPPAPVSTPVPAADPNLSPYLPPGPTLPETRAITLPADLPADRNILLQEITPEKMKVLIRRSEISRQRVNDEIDNLPHAQELLDMIRAGKTLLLSGKENFEEAERMFNEVEYRLALGKRVKNWAPIAYRLLSYEIIWLAGLGISAFILPQFVSGQFAPGSSFIPVNIPEFISADDVYTLISTMIWGGLGGVVGAMYSLWRHISVKQDFNPQHSIWYLTQPIMGIPIGAFIFIVLRAGIIVAYEESIPFSNPLIIYLFAWIASFQQNTLYGVVRQIIKLFRLDGPK